MKKIKTILFTLLCVFLVSSGTISAINIKETEEIFTELCKQSTDYNKTTNVLSTGGSLPWRITKITIQDGALSQVRKIQKMINRKASQFLRPSTIVPVADLDFTIKYRRDIVLTRSELSYGTTLIEYDNGVIINRTTVLNEEHTLQVDDFTGFFIFFRGKIKPFRPLKIRPAQFAFAGNCENVVILS